MHRQLLNPFINATTHCLSTMAQTAPVVGEPTEKQGKSTSGAVTGVLGMGGEQYTGCMIISFDELSIIAIVNRMLMENFTELTTEVVDAVGELTNMIVGAAKREFSEQGIVFDMASPLVLRGHGLVLHQLGNAPTIVLPFETGEGRFTVEANLAPTKTS